MAVSDLVREVEELLSRGHALLGAPGSGGPASRVGAGLTGAVDRLRTTPGQMVGHGGALPAHYGAFAARAGDALDAAAHTDHRLLRQVRAADRAHAAGWARSRAAVDGAHTDTAALASASDTPAAQRALIAALRARVSEQQRAIAACRARDARLAAALRALGYDIPGRGRSGRRPLHGNAYGNTPAGGPGSGRPVTLVGSTHHPAAPGASAGPPSGALTPQSSPREIAAAIIHEAHRRGYSRSQTTAILADALQESNLNPRAQSPNKLWYSIFQQDSSYPGRHDPNLAIAEFFNRLDRHGGPASTDIWKSIFWLQQRPGEPSAQAAFAHGRQAYLREIQSQTQRAAALYRDIVEGSAH